MLQLFVHYGLHFLFPGLLAYLFFRNNWKIIWLILIATMIVDLDHLLANPIYASNRCSINFHPLHSYFAISIYVVLSFFKKFRVLSLGLLLHMLVDFIDCLWMK
jgi:hypothetical protein